MKTYIVVGLGRFGAEVARKLCQLGSEVLAMDVSNELVQQIASDVTHAVVADARDKDVLKALGVRNFDNAVVAIGGDLASSVLAVMNLKELGIPHIVCKAHDETHRQVLMKLGADQVVIPEKEQAARLAYTLWAWSTKVFKIEWKPASTEGRRASRPSIVLVFSLAQAEPCFSTSSRSAGSLS